MEIHMIHKNTNHQLINLETPYTVSIIQNRLTQTGMHISQYKKLRTQL